MKKIEVQLKYIVILFSFIGVSCGDFLEEDYAHRGSADVHYRTKEGLDNGVKACYGHLRDMHHDKTMWLLGTDTYTKAGRPSSKDEVFNSFNDYSLQAYNPESTIIYNFWTTAYNAINLANRVLSEGEYADVDVNYKKQRLAEVKVLRALYYSYLVEQFGDIPFPLEPYEGVQTTAALVKEEDVYAQLIKDVESAVVEDKVAVKPENSGRVTEGVACTLLSKLFLTRAYKPYGKSDDFENAAKYAERVIANTQYGLLQEFSDIFKPGNEVNKEIIFAVQFSGSAVSDKYTYMAKTFTGNSLHSRVGIKYDVFPGMDRSTVYNRQLDLFSETLFLFDLFEFNGEYKTDKRFDGSFRRVFYADKDAKNYAKKVGASNPAKKYTILKGDTAIYIPYPNEAFSQEVVDKKNYVVVYEDYYQRSNYVEGDAWITVPKWNGNYENLRPSLSKFWEPGAYAEELGVRDKFIYRLADVYLTAAEAHLGMGDMPKAAERINNIRRRACGKPITSPSVMDVTSNEVNIDFILDERARELCGEDNRWCDLKRTRKLVERATKHNLFVKAAGRLQEYHQYKPYPYEWLVRLTNKDEIPQHKYN